MNLVEKINQVKIKADTRISGADRAFCERQQRAYDAAREALRELDFTWTDCISQQKMILDGERGSFNPLLLECLKRIHTKIRQEYEKAALGRKEDLFLKDNGKTKELFLQTIAKESEDF